MDLLSPWLGNFGIGQNVALPSEGKSPKVRTAFQARQLEVIDFASWKSARVEAIVRLLNSLKTGV